MPCLKVKEKRKTYIFKFYFIKYIYIYICTFKVTNENRNVVREGEEEDLLNKYYIDIYIINLGWIGLNRIFQSFNLRSNPTRKNQVFLTQSTQSIQYGLNSSGSSSYQIQPIFLHP